MIYNDKQRRISAREVERLRVRLGGGQRRATKDRLGCARPK